MGKTNLRDAMGAYKFLRIENVTYHGRKSKQAVCINLATNEETTFNDQIFVDISEGSFFTFNYNLNYPLGVVVITEDQVPAILKADKDGLAELHAEQARQKAANIATGRFRYYYTNFCGSMAENIIETISDNQDDFWQVLVDNLNSGERINGRPREIKTTIEQQKKDERIVKFMEEVKPGDKLGWYSWNGGFLAYSAGPCLIRDNEAAIAMAWIVS